jgi:hypothetical protein
VLTPLQANTQTSSEQDRQAWSAAMSQIPLPKNGCFTAAYPNLEWKEVPCGPPLKLPFSPASAVSSQN